MLEASINSTPSFSPDGEVLYTAKCTHARFWKHDEPDESFQGRNAITQKKPVHPVLLVTGSSKSQYGRRTPCPTVESGRNH